jgi:hypothetical protein
MTYDLLIYLTQSLDWAVARDADLACRLPHTPQVAVAWMSAVPLGSSLPIERTTQVRV